MWFLENRWYHQNDHFLPTNETNRSCRIRHLVQFGGYRWVLCIPIKLHLRYELQKIFTKFYAKNFRAYCHIFGSFSNFWLFFKGVIWCASCVYILFDHCPLEVQTITFIFMGMSFSYLKYNDPCGFWKKLDITKMIFLYPQMK